LPYSKPFKPSIEPNIPTFHYSIIPSGPEANCERSELSSRYEVLEVIAMPVIGGNQEYLEWIGKEVKKQAKG